MTSLAFHCWEEEAAMPFSPIVVKEDHKTLGNLKEVGGVSGVEKQVSRTPTLPEQCHKTSGLRVVGHLQRPCAQVVVQTSQ